MLLAANDQDEVGVNGILDLTLKIKKYIFQHQEAKA